MRKFIGKSVAAAALVVPAFVAVGASSAQAAQCPGPNNHPDVYSAGGLNFTNGASHGIDIHCLVVNSSNVVWWYARDTTTGKQGWVRGTDLSGGYTGAPYC
jgi:hypothetical protein